MKNKLLLSLGSSLLVFAPVMTVVACGEDTPAAETQEQKDVKTAKSALTAAGALGTAGSWTSTMTSAEWEAITATTTDQALTDATYITNTLEVAGKTLPATTALAGTTLKYTIAKTTSVLTFTVKISKGTANDSIAYTIAKPASAATTAAAELLAAEAYFTTAPELAATVTTAAQAQTALLALITVKHESYDYTISSIDFGNKTFKIKVTHKTTASDTATSASNKTFTTNELDIVNLKTLTTGANKLGAAGAWTSTMTSAEWEAITATTTDAVLTTGIITNTWLVAGKSVPTSSELDGATIKYALTKTTSTITITVKLAKGAATDTIVYTIAKPNAVLTDQDKANADRNTLDSWNIAFADKKTYDEIEALLTGEPDDNNQPTPEFMPFTQTVATALGFGDLPSFAHSPTLTYKLTADETEPEWMDHESGLAIPNTPVYGRFDLTIRVTVGDATADSTKVIESSDSFQEWFAEFVVTMFNMLATSPEPLIMLPRGTTDEQTTSALIKEHTTVIGGANLFEMFEEIGFVLEVKNIDKTEKSFVVGVSHPSVANSIDTEPILYGIHTMETELEAEVTRIQMNSYVNPVVLSEGTELVSGTLDSTENAAVIAEFAAALEFDITKFIYEITVTIDEVNGNSFVVKVTHIEDAEVTGTTAGNAFTIGAATTPGRK